MIRDSQKITSNKVIADKGKGNEHRDKNVVNAGSDCSCEDAWMFKDGMWKEIAERTRTPKA